jgi:hypothetical protein
VKQQHIGWITVLAAFGMFLGLLAVEIAGLRSWADALTTVFIGKTIGHFAAVIAAFVGGKFLPQFTDDTKE